MCNHIIIIIHDKSFFVNKYKNVMPNHGRINLLVKNIINITIEFIKYLSININKGILKSRR